MTAILARLAKWFGASALDRVLDAVDRKVDSETERQRIRGEVVQEFARSQGAMLTGRGWWFPLLFIGPLGVWFGAVCIYSVLFHKNGPFPQSWDIAALPSPLNEWAGAIIGSLFVAKLAPQLISLIRR